MTLSNTSDNYGAIAKWLSNRRPDPEPGTPLEHLAAKLGHYALYAIMIIAPLTGHIGTGVNTGHFFLFDITKFDDTGDYTMIAGDTDLKTYEKLIDFVHS